MLDALRESLQQMASPETLMFLLIGVLLGMLTGLLPGLGGSVGMALLLPFIFGVEPASAIAMLVGIMAVNNTSDTFTAILLGVPGSSSSQATIMDGYPLARMGQGSRALGAALFGSMVGGVLGAIALVAFIPIATPLILALGSPQLLMLMLIGVATVGVLSGSKPLAGLLTALLGMLIGAIGAAPSGPPRYIMFDWIYLHEGISLVLLVLGLYALPELLNLLKERSPVSKSQQLVKGGIGRGVRDVLKNKFLVLGSSVYAIVAGTIPGLSGAAVSWTAYAGAKTACRDTRNFGKGDVRGVIAPDSCNNAMEGGNLVPTMMFGIPGSASGAILLGGLLIVGVQPGRDMIEGPGLTLLLVTALTLALANVIATGLAMAGAPYIARISRVNPGLLVPAIFLVVVFAAYQVHTTWDDIAMLLLLGLIGIVLYSRGWPRAPMLIGFVLGSKVEASLRISLDRFGLTWLENPIVIALGLVLVAILVAGVVLSVREVRTSRAPAVAGAGPGTGSAGGSASGSAGGSAGGSGGGGRELPQTEVVRESAIRRAPMIYWIGWLLLLVLVIGVCGMAIGGAVWLVAFLKREVAQRWRAIAIYLVGYAAVVVILTRVAGTQLPTSWIF